MGSNEDESTAGYVMRLVDEAYRSAYSFAWVIDQPDFCFNIQYKSKQFSTGIDKQNVWQLGFEVTASVPECHMYLNLKSCTEPGAKMRVTLSFLGDQGVKFFENERGIDGTVRKKFHNYQYARELSKINHGKLVICCRISDCIPAILISNLISRESRGVETFEGRLSHDFETIMKNGRLSDVTLVVGDQEMHAHKVVLASRSPVFMATFESDMQEKRSNTINIPDVEPDVMQKLLSYVYTDRVENIEESAKELIAAAEKYQIEGLKSLCLKAMMETLTERNAIETLILADLYRAEDLKNQIYNFIAVHAKNIHELEGYDSLGQSGRADLLEALSAIGAVRDIHQLLL